MLYSTLDPDADRKDCTSDDCVADEIERTDSVPTILDTPPEAGRRPKTGETYAESSATVASTPLDEISI